VVEYIVAIDVTRVRFPAGAFFVFAIVGSLELMGQPTQDHILLWGWPGRVWHQFYDNGLPELTGPLDRGKAIVLSNCSKMSFATPCKNA
jgi:hypothetical protein